MIAQRIVLNAADEVCVCKRSTEAECVDEWMCTRSPRELPLRHPEQHRN